MEEVCPALRLPLLAAAGDAAAWSAGRQQQQAMAAAAAGGGPDPEAQLLVAAVLVVWMAGVLCGVLVPPLLRALWRHAGSAALVAPAHPDGGAAAPPTAGSLLLYRALSDMPDFLEATPRFASGSGTSGSGVHVVPRWQLEEADLQRFEETVAPVEDRLLTGDLSAHGWSHIMSKEQPGWRYAGYLRPAAGGTTDYLSVTIMHGATAQEVQEFTLDDAVRLRWDPLLKAAWLLEADADARSSCSQFVAWLRSFPMGLVGPRLYAGISRREYNDPARPHCLWGVTKVMHTPASLAWAAEHFPGVTLTTDYYSAWQARTLLSPWSAPGGPPEPACALILLHHDDLQVPEQLARSAIKLGMARFVRGMVDHAAGWVQRRRGRGLSPFAPDPGAACRHWPAHSSAAAAAGDVVAADGAVLADAAAAPGASQGSSSSSLSGVTQHPASRGGGSARVAVSEAALKRGSRHSAGDAAPFGPALDGPLESEPVDSKGSSSLPRADSLHQQRSNLPAVRTRQHTAGGGRVVEVAVPGPGPGNAAAGAPPPRSQTGPPAPPAARRPRHPQQRRRGAVATLVTAAVMVLGGGASILARRSSKAPSDRAGSAAAVPAA